MTATIAERPALEDMTEQELCELIATGSDDERSAAIALVDQREAAQRKAGAIRTASRERNSEWEDAARASFAAAEEYCRGDDNMLNAAGRARGMSAWDLWQGAEDLARRFASDEVLRFWDHVTPRTPGPADYARAKREALAEAKARHEDTQAREGTPMIGAIAGAAIRAGINGAQHRQQASPAPSRAERVEALRAQAQELADRSAARKAARALDTPPGLTSATAPAEVALRAASAVGGVPVASPARPGGGSQRIDGARVLSQAYGYLGHMAHWTSDAARITAALYAAHTHARDEKTRLSVFLYEPHLFFTSVAGGSGKSWTARLTASLCPDPKRLGEMTKASLVNLLAQHHTVIITELDKLVGTSGKRSPWLPGIVNMTFEFDGATSRKQGGAVQEIPLFAPVILDGKDCLLKTTGDELTTMMDRCITIRCEPGPMVNGEAYRPPRYDTEKRAIAHVIGKRMAQWMAQEVKDGIGDHVPDVPRHLGNRPFDLWEPLFTVAERAGGTWPELARYACEHLEAPAADDESEADRIDDALDSWGAPVPALPEFDD